MRYWLMKSEPDVFSIEDLRRSPGRSSLWDGVRNYQVRNMLRDDFAKGDLAFFYQSSCAVPGIVGTMEVLCAGYPDPTAFMAGHEHFDPASDRDKPRWYTVESPSSLIRQGSVFGEDAPASSLFNPPGPQNRIASLPAVRSMAPILVIPTRETTRSPAPTPATPSEMNRL